MPDESPVNLKPYMNNGLHVRLADWFYRTICQPIVNLVEKVEARWTARWCEDRIPAKERVK